MKKFVCFAFLASSMLSSPVGAEVLKNVSIEGTRRFEPASVMRNLNISQGQNLTAYYRVPSIFPNGSRLRKLP